MTYGMQCEAQTSACKQRNPQWLHWLCDGFNKTCRSSNALCAAWNAVCTNSDRVCNVWGNACEIDVPDWIITCFWENNPGYPVLRQLQDGKSKFLRDEKIDFVSKFVLTFFFFKKKTFRDKIV
jgi:hypothetical protein